MNKRNITIILAAVLAILSIYMLIADKDLSIKSKEVTMLYDYLGEIGRAHV